MTMRREDTGEIKYEVRSEGARRNRVEWGVGGEGFGCGEQREYERPSRRRYTRDLRASFSDAARGGVTGYSRNSSPAIRLPDNDCHDHINGCTGGWEGERASSDLVPP